MDMRKICLSVILVCFMEYYVTNAYRQADPTTTVQTPSPTNYKGMYAFPCLLQNRAYGAYPITSKFGFRGTRSCDDPTVITVTVNGTVDRVYELVDVSGQFYVFRSEDATQPNSYKYRCTKYLSGDLESNILVAYESKWESFTHRPTICEICRGQQLDQLVLQDDTVIIDPRTVKIPELGCNIPIICPGGEAGQIKCTCASHKGSEGDGFCCEKCKTQNNMKK